MGSQRVGHDLVTQQQHCFVVESVVPQLAGGKAMIEMQVSLALKTSSLPLGMHTAVSQCYKILGGFLALN